MRSGMRRPIRYFAPLGVQWRTQALPIIVAFVCTETSVPGGIAFSASTSIPKLLMSMARAWRMRSPSLPRQQRRTWRWTALRACSRLPAPFSVTAPACFGSDCGRLMARLRTQHLLRPLLLCCSGRNLRSTFTLDRSRAKRDKENPGNPVRSLSLALGRHLMGVL